MSNHAILPYDKALHGPSRKSFKSGSPALDSYFQVQLSQDLKSRVTSCFVATDPGGLVVGFYTLSSSGVALTELPQETARRLPRYPLIPVVRMGRLAIDTRFQGLGFGGILLADALDRAAHSGIGSFALVVDAKDQGAAAFYAHHGFLPFPDEPLIWFLPLAKVP